MNETKKSQTVWESPTARRDERLTRLSLITHVLPALIALGPARQSKLSFGEQAVIIADDTIHHMNKTRTEAGNCIQCGKSVAP